MKKILITGATSMIGRACVEHFDDPSNHLILLGRDLEKLKALSSTLSTKSDILAVDFSSAEEVQTCMKDILTKHEEIDTFIYNSAIYPWELIEDLSAEQWQQTLNINLSGAFYITQALMPLFKQQKAGNIVYLSSLAAENVGLPYMSAYTATKAGLNGLMRTCALELAPYDVNVNAISPGKIWDTSTLSKKEIAEKLNDVPLKRFISTARIAKMINFLRSDGGKDITGQNLIVDAGASIDCRV
jgi:3-oxoacyl-[acyl-carrier protein] reductase